MPYKTLGSLDNIGDVHVPDPQDGQTLTWNAVTERWEAGARPTATTVSFFNLVLNETSSGSTSPFNAFAEAAYGGVPDHEVIIPGVGIAWVPGTGRFVVEKAGIYKIDLVMQMLKAVGNGTVTVTIYRNDVLYLAKAFYTTTQTGESQAPLHLFMQLNAGGYFHVTVDSDGADNVQVEDGTRIAIHSVG